MLVKILAPGYFARQDMKTPVRYGIWAMAANMVFNLILVWHFDHVGLAMATAMAACFNAGLLAWGLWRLQIWQPTTGWWRWWMTLVLANGTLLIVIWWLNDTALQWLQWNLWQRIGQMLLLTFIGIVVYVTVLLLSGVRRCDFRGPST